MVKFTYVLNICINFCIYKLVYPFIYLCISLPWKSPFLHLFISPPLPLATNSRFFFTVSVALSSEKCHILFGIIQYVDFSDWLLSLSNMHLSFLCVFSDLIDHFYCWVPFRCMDIWRASWLLPVFGDYDEVLYIYIHTHTCTHIHTYMYIQTLEKDPDAGKDWGQEEKGETGWDGWMASPTQWTGVWASSGRWWRMQNPGVLQSMGLQRDGHDWAREQQQQQ